MGDGKSPEWWDEWVEGLRAQHGNGNGHGNSLAVEALRLLPTPTAADSKASGGAAGSSNVTLTDATVRRALRFGQYAEAVTVWERITGNPAPDPTEVGPKGGARLSPRFPEWMMGLPPGWVDVPGVSRTEQLKACGNGVVPQQAAAALSVLVRLAGAEVRP